MSRYQYRPSRRSTLFVIIAGFVTVVGLLILGPETAVAEMCQWTGAVNTDWNNAGNWSCAIVPGANDEVILDNSVVSGSYSIILPGSATTTTISKLTISPNSGNNITLNLPSTNTGIPGFSVGDNIAATDDIILNDGAILSNSSGATSGNGIQVNSTSNGTIRINNGGRYIHNTARSTAGIVPRLSIISGTEQGIFEYNFPGTGSAAISASGRNYGALFLTRTSGTGTYAASGASNLTIRGDFVINSGVTFNSTMTADTLIGGNWTQNGTGFSHTSTVIFNGASQQQIGGSAGTNFNNLTIANTASVIIPTNTSVTGLLTNNGRLQQTRDVNGSGDVTFLDIGGYGGVTLNANSGDLGQTTVIIRGNQPCDNDNSSVRRCFDIDPANKTGRNATVSFVWDSTELGSQICSTMDAYHWNGASWGTPLTLDTGYGTNGRICTDPGLQSLRVTGVTTFSPFAMSSDGSGPTAVSLQSFTAHNQTPILLILAALLMLGLVGATAVFRHKTNSR